MNAKRSPVRQALAAAIEARRAAESRLIAAHEGVNRASERKWAAEAELEKLREENAKLPSAADQYVAAIAAGGDCDVAVLDRPVIPADESKLQNEIATWVRTREEIQASIPEHERALHWADHYLNDAVAAVIRDEAPVDALLSGLERLRSELQRRLTAIGFIAGFAEGEMAERLRAAHGRLDADRGVHDAWAAARVALRADADAALPSA